MKKKKESKSMTGWTSVKDPERRKKLDSIVGEVITKAKKEAKFTTRINESLFKEFKEMAVQKNMPYQTLLHTIISDYVNGVLVNVEEIKKLFPKFIK